MPEWAPLESFFGSPPPPPSTALAPPPPHETPQPPPVRESAASNSLPIPSRAVAAPPPVPAYIKRRVKSATPEQAEPEASVWVKALIPAQFGLYIGLVAPFNSGGDSRHPTPFVEKVWLALLGGVALFAIVYLISVIWYAIAGRKKASVVPNADSTSKDVSSKKDGTGLTTANQQSGVEEKTPIGPVGISGWLLLPAIGILGKPLTVISAIWNEYLLSKILQPGYLISASFYVSCAMGGIVIAYAMIVAWYFFRRNPVAPKIFVQFLVFGIVTGIASRLIAANYNGSDFDWAGSAGSVIGSGVWILYFLKSKRVKATFTSAPIIPSEADSRASKVHNPPIVPVSVWFWLANGAVLALMFWPMEDQLSQSVASQTEPPKGAQPSADTSSPPKLETPATMSPVVTAPSGTDKKPTRATTQIEFDSMPLSTLATAADSGDVNAQIQLGIRLDRTETESGYIGAVKWFTKAAEQGNALAQFAIGMMHERGRGVVESPSEAIRWYRMAAEQGEPNAQYCLGLISSEGKSVQKDSATAAEWFAKAAEKGHAQAQARLGLAHETGEGVPLNKAEAMKWYRMAADQGYSEAQCRLGWQYYSGEVVRQDISEALQWYRKAADQDHVDAQYMLGLIYYNGLGVPQDLGEALKWHGKAATQGNSRSQFILGKSYFRGEGVPKSSIHAYMHLSLALVLDDQSTLSDVDREQAKNAIQLLTKQMTASGIAHAQAQVRDFINASDP